MTLAAILYSACMIVVVRCTTDGSAVKWPFTFAEVLGWHKKHRCWGEHVSNHNSWYISLLDN